MKLKRFRNWTIQVKLLSTVLTLVLLPLVIVSYLTLTGFSKSLTEGASLRLEQVVSDLRAMCEILIEAADETMAADMSIAKKVIDGKGNLRKTNEKVVVEEQNNVEVDKIYAGPTLLTNNEDLATNIQRLIGESFSIYQVTKDRSLIRVAKSLRKSPECSLAAEVISADDPIAVAVRKGSDHSIRMATADKYFTVLFSPLTDSKGKTICVLAIGEREESITALRNVIVEAQVGETGYAYTMRSEGTLQIHPAKSGSNILESKDSAGNYYIREMCEKALLLSPGQTATIRYPWINPELGDIESRMKVAKYTYLPQWDWIIAAGSYESEIYSAARRTRTNTLIIIGLTAIAVLIMTMGIARRLTRPLRRMSMASRRMAEGDLSVRVHLYTDDEIGEMGSAFNHMANQIERYTKNLQVLVAEKTKELRQTKEYFESIVESSADMIITTDKGGKITFANKATSKTLGYPNEQLKGRHVSMLYPKGFQKAGEIMNMLREAGSFSNYEMPLIKFNNDTLPILTSAALLQDDEGRVMGTVGIFTDITKRKMLEAELRKTQASLVQAGKMRAMGDLVSGVAHELNNPLMASQSIVHVIKSKLSLGDPNARRMEIIAKCNNRMEKIINHLREFSRADEHVKTKINLNEPIENTLMITGQQLLNHNVVLKKDIAPNLPKIYGDINQLEQVFLNLVANAKDSMEESTRAKELTIRTFAERTADGTWVKATVTDSGTGIPDDIMEKIFNPFFSTKEADKGTGLGLAITYGIIEDHNGTVDVKTRVGVGTMFTISIPSADDLEKKNIRAKDRALSENTNSTSGEL